MTPVDVVLLGVIAAGLAALAGLANRLADRIGPKPRLVPIPIPVRDPRR